MTTELLFALGAGGRVVGRTHWDLSPAAASAVPDLGNGMQPNVEAVLGVHPDLVVIYASPSNRAAAVQLRKAGVNTLAIRDDRISDFRRTVAMLARATGDTIAGLTIADSVERSLAAVRARPRPPRPATVFWHVWDSPILTIGRGSYLDELVTIAGAQNIFNDLAEPSPQVTLEEIVRRNPDFILVGPASASDASGCLVIGHFFTCRQSRVASPTAPGVENVSAPREGKRWNSAAASTGAGTPSSLAACSVQRPSPESETRPAKSIGAPGRRRARPR